MTYHTTDHEVLYVELELASPYSIAVTTIDAKGGEDALGSISPTKLEELHNSYDKHMAFGAPVGTFADFLLHKM